MIDVRVMAPQGIKESSWLNDPKYEWFRRGYGYAATQTRAIPALSQNSPEELYILVWAVMRGAGLGDPDGTRNKSVMPFFDEPKP